MVACDVSGDLLELRGFGDLELVFCRLLRRNGVLLEVGDDCLSSAPAVSTIRMLDGIFNITSCFESGDVMSAGDATAASDGCDGK